MALGSSSSATPPHRNGFGARTTSRSARPTNVAPGAVVEVSAALEDLPVEWETGPCDTQEFCVSMPNLTEHPPDWRKLPDPLRGALHFLAVADLQPTQPSLPSTDSAVLLGPPKAHVHAATEERLTLVLDLDETLVHCTLEPSSRLKHNFCVAFEETQATGFVFVRPYARLFLEVVARLFEVIVFTASSQSYADQVLDQLDPEGTCISFRLYRQHCTELFGGFLKDMRRLGRPLDRIILVDNSPVSLGLCPDNGIVVSSWTAEQLDDRELLDLMLLLQQCMNQASVPEFLSQRFGLRRCLEFLRCQPEVLLGHNLGP